MLLDPEVAPGGQRGAGRRSEERTGVPGAARRAAQRIMTTFRAIARFAYDLLNDLF